MKLNNQCNKTQNTLKRVTIFAWFYNLRFCYFILLLLPSLSFSGGGEPGFCWAVAGENTCNFPNKDLDRYDDSVEADVSYPINGDQSFRSSPRFQFRSGCHSNSNNNCDVGWKLDFVEFQKDGIPVEKGDFNDGNHYVLNTEFSIPEFGHDNNNFQWPIDNEINGDAEDLNPNGMSGDMFLNLTIKERVLKSLSAGEHVFTVVLKGYDSDEKSVKYLYYNFNITASGNKQVRISGLDDYSLGLFPGHLPYDSKNFCIHASGDGLFTIRAEGGDKRTSNFELSSTANNQKSTIPYLPMFGVGNDVPERSLLEMNSQTEDETFVGHEEDYCGGLGNTNMTLAIRLNATFQQLSQKPAGNYTDTLTLVVEAK
ncbi:hypothetical protein [Endozoicomonas lisbonensis]|uniref:Spore coat protein U domain-containing protein n=1 Tax=Endozoicomonas lisbonensis TaxID=3120522 RepID=A0ABV2SG77_9GAMM